MRFGTLGPAALALAATTLGCAQVAGIQDVSGSIATQHCVDTANSLRSMAGLPALTRWLDHEQCADEAASIQASGGTFPDCLGSFAWESDAQGGMVDPDSMLQQTVMSIWGESGHGDLGSSTHTKLACGYAYASDFSGSALIYGD
jgi:hypothetical protein